MTRTTTVLVGAALALTVGAGAQIALYHHSAPSISTVRASWSFTPTSSQQVRARAQSIVLGKVVSVSAGPDIVTAQPGEPGGVDRIPTRRVTVTVVKPYKGTTTAGQQLTLFQTGGTASQPAAPARGTKAGQSTVQQVVLEGDPAYRAGEQYLLMLEPGPQGTMRPVSPEGRYRASSDGALTAMVRNTVTSQVTAAKLTALEPTLRAS